MTSPGTKSSYPRSSQSLTERSPVCFLHRVCVCVCVIPVRAVCMCLWKCLRAGCYWRPSTALAPRPRDANLRAEMTSFTERHLGALNLIGYSMFFVCTRIGYARAAPFADPSWPMVGDRVVYLWTLPMFHCNGWCFPWTVTAGESRQNHTHL